MCESCFGDKHMKLIKVAIVLTWFTLGLIVGNAQEINTRKPDHFVTKFTVTLFTADAVVRSLDGYSTLKNLSNPCRCFHESNPIAPKGSSVAAEAGFQAGALALTYGSAWLLNKHHHPKMARAVMMFDIGAESYYVGRNFTRREVDVVTGTTLKK